MQNEIYANCGSYHHKNSVHLQINNFDVVISGCHKRFSSRQILKKHSNIDSKEKPFICNYKGCEKTFSRKDYLEIDINRHLG